jgi:hypothetical protein
VTRVSYGTRRSTPKLVRSGDKVLDEGSVEWAPAKGYRSGELASYHSKVDAYVY